MRYPVALVLCCLLQLGPTARTPAAEPTTPPIDFAAQIRPIFERTCFRCHGPDKQESDLRLDRKAAALKGGYDGPVFVPGDSAASHLIQRVSSDDPDLRMPPEGEPLSADEIALLTAWIDAGGEWPDDPPELADLDKRSHWAFQPPVRPAEPAVGDESWIKNPIDRFVLARLEREGLAHSPEADSVTLLRRLHFDLTGLPPTIGEVDAFLADTAPGAYDRAVSRLLDSPHYGERWGRHWLDAARYADSDGYEKDKSRQVWFYRDWVIDAVNRDLPYDQFVIEQLAGDQLPHATQDQIVATGFLRNSMINEEGGVDPEQFRMEAMFDRMDAIGKSVLGLTIQCAQCHSHKFDPLTQDDYYRMFAFLNNDYEANVAVYSPQQQIQRADIFRQIAEIDADLQHRYPDWAERMAAWEETVKADQPEWTVVSPVAEENSTGGQKYLPQPDGSFLAQGYAPTKHTVKMTIKVDAAKISAFRLELLTDPNLPLHGPGRSVKGTAALTEFEVLAAPADSPDPPQPVKWASATADLNPPETPLDAIYYDNSDKRRVTGPIGFAIDANHETAWGTDAGPGRRNQPRKAVFIPEAPIENAAGTTLTFQIVQNHGGWNSDDNQSHNLGRFRLSISAADGATADPLPESVREILAVPADQRSPDQVAVLFGYWRTTVPEWQAENDRIEALWRQHPEGSSQLVLASRDDARMTRILKRGDFLNPENEVAAGVPAFLHPLPEGAPPSRLTFARWLVDRGSPTAARAIVNRVWQSYFGTGLVATSEDLGTQSERPSHPELLDWLAVEFMDQGWSLKKLHRLIVSSATYRQSSRVTPEAYAADQDNRLLARGPRFRVDAEIVRDVALAASGLLNPQVGGPSVFPPLPEFMLLPPVSYGPKIWHTDTGPNRYRRAIYTFRYRSLPYPVLQTFDAPNGDFACVRRARSNTPLQALMTLNEPVFVEAAQALALRTLTEAGATDDERLAHAFRLCLSRHPSPAEAAELTALYQAQKQRIAEGWLNAWDIAAPDSENPPDLPEGATPTELAALTAVSRVLLNLDETITKE